MGRRVGVRVGKRGLCGVQVTSRCLKDKLCVSRVPCLGLGLDMFQRSQTGWKLTRLGKKDLPLQRMQNLGAQERLAELSRQGCNSTTNSTAVLNQL